MLDNLNTLVKEEAGEAIVNNPAIPNEKNDEAVKETSEAITESLQSSLQNGNEKEVLRMFSTGNADSNNPVVQQASDNVAQKLQQKLGLNVQQAFNVANGLVPAVLKSLTQKTADPNNQSFNLQNIFNQLTGGKTSGLDMQGLMTKFKSKLDQDGDGDADLQDLKAFFSGKGSVMDKLKGLFR